MNKWLILGLLCFIAGCSTTLEDGYKPRPLGATDGQRRAYYASPFSPESHSGERDGSAPMFRPGF